MNTSLPSILRSLRVWIASISLILLWVPFLAVIRLFDRDKNVMRTGLWFRRLGRALTKTNPFWKLKITGSDTLPESRAYVVVSNHQSMADIPLISNLKWEMKWVGKKELFRTPIIGWLMSMAGDIPLDRKDSRSGARMIRSALKYLNNGCPVMFFPEGTRTPDGTVRPFTDSAFYLAIKANVSVLPVAVEGSYQCLPKRSWVFGSPAEVRMRVFAPLETTGMTMRDVSRLRDTVRGAIIEQIAAWKGLAKQEVDALARSSQ
ncbi:MAG: 1-acyl-sn-glycerol-3-phosphate acyltransferase [Ignavibacteria bacterium]|nr:1-acyl-sn-glycerol-3-phosphate acyltransferase [Ignavibacteria bacterium]